MKLRHLKNNFPEFKGSPGWLLILCFSFLQLSCRKGHWNDCIKRAGPEIIETRVQQGFRRVELYDRINLHLVQDSLEFIQIKTGENLVEFISTNQEGRILTIKNENSCNWTRKLKTPINVYLHFIDLRRIVFRGSGNITSENNMNLDSLRVDVHEGTGSIQLNLNARYLYTGLHSGAADITLNGNSINSDAFARGNGLLDLRNMSFRNCYAVNESPSDFYLYVTENLRTKITGDGNIYYSGNPAIVTEVDSGRGKVQKL